MAGKLENILRQGDCIPEEMLLQYISGELTPHDSHLVEKHLLECEFCSDALEGLKTIAPQKSKAIIADLNDRIDERIRSTEHQTAKIIPITRWYRIAAAAALLILFGGGYWYFSSQKENNMIAENKPEKDLQITDTIPVPEQPQLSSASQEDQSEPAPLKTRFAPPKEMITANSKAMKETVSDEIAGSVAGTAPVREPVKIESEVAMQETKQTETTSGVTVKNAARESRSATGEPTITESNMIVLDRASSGKDVSYNRKVDNTAIDTKAIFESGKAQYELKNYGAAENDFEKLMDDTSTVYYDEAKWLLANCYMRNHKNAKARKLLKEIANSESGYKKKAFGLLQEMQ